MIDLEYLEKIKDALDADSTLNSLLETVEGVSKVLIGPEYNSEEIAAPCIVLFDGGSNIISMNSKFGQAVFGVNIITENTAYNRPDYSTMNSIARQVNSLISDQQFELSNNKCIDILEDGSLQAVADSDTTTLRQLRYRLIAV